MVEMASRLRLPVLWPFGRMAAWRRQVQVHWMRQPYVSDSRHHLRPDPHSTHGLAFSLLVFREWQRWDLGAELKRTLEIGSYQTVWAILHRLRSGLIRPDRERLC